MIFQATASRSGSESGGTEGRKSYLERNAHKTNGLGVETLVVQVCPEGHGTSAQSRRVFLNRKLRAVKVCSHCNQRTLRCVVAGSVAGMRSWPTCRRSEAPLLVRVARPPWKRWSGLPLSKTSLGLSGMNALPVATSPVYLRRPNHPEEVTNERKRG